MAGTPVLVVVLALCSGLTGSAAAAPSSSGGDEAAPTTPSTYTLPSAAELAAQQAQVAKLAAQVSDQSKALAAAQAQSERLQAQLAAAQQAEAAATVAQATAQTEETAQNQRLAAATALVQQRKMEDGQWAATTYRDGQLDGVEKMMALLSSRNTDDLAQRMQMLNLVGRWRGSVVDTVEEARAVQADATARAQAAAAAATKAQSDAAAAKASAQAAMTQQTEQLMLIQTLLAQSQAQMTAAQNQNQAMMNSMTTSMLAKGGAATNNVMVGPVDPSCPGGDVSGYANGQIPVSLLCPLVNYPQHHLRADAAKAFNDMSMAYALQFGNTICVTDSYRSLSEQVSVKASKPGLAATPGTSRHGLAVAVDLCGGIQGFGTPQHVWMQQNAPKFGWCDPMWARSGGSKPEPWHWQYMDCVH